MSIIAKLHELCLTQNISISVAESCTSGNIASALSLISNSSGYFKGGIIAYQNLIKINILNVSKELIEKETEVSSRVVKQMANHVLLQFQSDFSVATTGYAGPNGGDDKNPVGTVYIAVANKSKTKIKKLFFNGDRQDVVNQATETALRLLYDEIKKQT